MKNSLKAILPISLILVVSFITPAFAVKYSTVSGYAQVSGDSTLHKWDMKGYSVSGSVETKAPNAKAANINDFAGKNVSLSLSVPVKSLKSGKDGLDENGYKAMKATTSPNITFVLSQIEVKKVDGKKATVVATGTLTMAGTPKVVSLWGSVTLAENGNITVTASMNTKLTYFGIEPPTAMLGTIRTKDDVSLYVTWTLKPQ